MKVNIIRTESVGPHSTVKSISETLNQAIKDFVGEDEQIINIQLVQSNGLSRFWIYTAKAREIDEVKK